MVLAGADTAEGAQAAHALVGAGAAVVLVGRDAGALGVLARALLDAGARVAVMRGDLGDADTRAALAEMVHELFEGRAS